YQNIISGWCTRVEAHNKETLKRLVLSRENTPLITVCNHFSCFDDPGVWALLRWRDLWNTNRMRWSLAAHDICFNNAISNWFFSAGKCVPVIRGNGVYQQGIDFCLERLNEGSWVHVFPEGKVNMTLEHVRLKWGVGRLVYESAVPPIVLPIYHMGMDSFLPNKEPYLPRLLKKVTVVIGDPIDFSDVLSTIRAKNQDDLTARKIITDIVQEELARLRARTERLHQQRFL
ncbi:UNVERIFIED_CONTAM: hypothetical protein GTU68_054075, partial [Idotea baltica]|nr:hypothetical protein [Idotea baltica]